MITNFRLFFFFNNQHRKWPGALLFLMVLCWMIASCDSPDPVSIRPFNKNETLTSHIYFGDKLAGGQVTSVLENGHITSAFKFNDRGRGPQYTEEFRLDGQGRLIFHSIEGHNYLKDSVGERFEVIGGRASWKSTSEEGNVNFNEQHFISNDGSFTNAEILVRRLIANPNEKIELLPGGVARLTDQMPYTSSDSTSVILYGIGGLGFVTQYVWLDENDRFFASISDWFSCIREGHQMLKDELFEQQTALENRSYERMYSELTDTPQEPLVVSNVRVFDPISMELRPPSDVVIEGDQITQVSLHEEGELPSDARVIDGNGRVALPGLFDMHVHYGKSDGLLHLGAGVTSVRDLANSLTLVDIKKQIEEKEIIGPNIVVMAGFVDGAGPYAGPTGAIINDVQEGKAGIDDYHNLGYQHIKLYSSIKPEWVKPLVSHAQSRGMTVSGHIPAFMTASQAIDMGYDEIQHVNMIFLNFYSDTLDTRTPLRFTTVAKEGYKLDTEGPAFQKFMRQLSENDIVVDPTVSIFEGMFKSRAGEVDPAYEMVVDRLPVQVKRGLYQGGLPREADQDEIYEASHDRMLDVINAMHEAGITLVPGTDAMPGFTLHRELELYVKAGISPVEVLKMATLTAAKVSNVDDRLGSIEPGKLADIVLVDGDPTQNISDIRNTFLTVSRGRLYDPKDLYQAIGVLPE